jgi:adenosylcobinamide-GDP ribazoletransferase
MKNQLRLFLTALMFYTRIPVPKGIDYSGDALNQSTRYFPLIGIIVGGFAALVFYLSSFIFYSSISIILSMIASVLITGAFHEDGFADVCDGFGGGYTINQKLTIMKDSRVGTYGLLGLFFLMMLKYLLLKELSFNVVAVLIAIHALSRLSPVLLIYHLEYVRKDTLSKVKPIGKKIKISELIIAIVFAIFPLYLLGLWGFVLIIPLLFIQCLSAWFFKRHLGGYTGDCLGATQQVAEIFLYVCYFLLCTYIL